MTPRAIPSTLAERRPTAYTVVQIAPGVYRYEYVRLVRVPPLPRWTRA